MQPIDFAEKWSRAGYALWCKGRERASLADPNAHTLALRLDAHYGSVPHGIEHIMAVAALEAMNEYDVYRTQLDHDARQRQLDAMSSSTTLAGVPYADLDY